MGGEEGVEVGFLWCGGRRELRGGVREDAYGL